MNKIEFQNFIDPKRHILSLACGVLGGALPNKNSNMHPLLTGAILAGLIVKIIYGDYDTGYQWTFSDLIFWVMTLTEGVLGALLISSF